MSVLGFTLHKASALVKAHTAQGIPDEPLLDALAEAIHNMWMGWAVHAMESVDAKTRRRWKPMLVPYDNLPDEEKQKDRVEAIALLDIARDHQVAKTLGFPVAKGYLTTAYGEGRAPTKTPDAGKRQHQTAAIDAATSEESLPTIRLNGFTPNTVWTLLRQAGYRLRITEGQAMLPGHTTVAVTPSGAVTITGAKAATYAQWLNGHLHDMVDWAGQIDGKQEVSSIRSHGGHFS